MSDCSRHAFEVPEKPILDPCCGSRMFYFNKSDPRVLFCDIRDGVHEELCDGRTLEVKPDRVEDVTNLPFPDGSFPLVILDPPHLTNAGDGGWQAKKYGKLPKDWRAFITRAFEECWRVLAPNGTLVFKWYEYRVKLSQILELIPEEPVFGNKCPHTSKTHWLVFFKAQKAQKVPYSPPFRGGGYPATRVVCSNCGDRAGVFANFCKKCGLPFVEHKEVIE